MDTRVEANKLIARRFVEEVLDGGSQEVANELFLPGAVRHFPPGDLVMGPDQPAPRAAGRSMSTDIHHLHGEGDLVTIHLTHHVVFEPGARFPTRMGWIDVGGRTVAWIAIALLRFEDNRIAEEWVVRDELHVALQAGVVGPIG
jgi:predicted SnoaL-like aldol condensation-catalyzing enzyme